MALECYQHKLYTNRSGKKTLEAGFRNIRDLYTFIKAMHKPDKTTIWINDKRFTYENGIWCTWEK